MHPREVGYFYRATTIQYRLFTKLGDARPFGGIVDVHIQGKPVVQAVDETVIHDIVHLVRNTFAGSFFADGSCKRMLIALQELFGSYTVCLSATPSSRLIVATGYFCANPRVPQMVCERL